MQKKIYTSFLHLEDGSRYKGWSFSKFIQSTGEVVFNTGMTGYQEVITDPSYYKQIILFTYPEIGNTGVNILDLESDSPLVTGIIAKNICDKPSSWRKNISLIDYLVSHKVPHIFGVDTRLLTKKLRNKGVMAGCISNSRLQDNELTTMGKSVNNFSSHHINYVSTKKTYNWNPTLLSELSQPFSVKKSVLHCMLKVVVIDYGVKFNILNRLQLYGCSVTVVPAYTSTKNLLSLKPDGVLLSNGPGDPSLIRTSVLRGINQLIDSNIPVFGICLGHQLLSLALGASTSKLKFGHRGLNHPSGAYNIVKMTSQNHGYVVSTSTVSDQVLSISSLNCNDNTLSGIVHKKKPCFSVQYHPEASPGPHDSDFLFSHFITVMLACKKSSC